MILWIKAFHVIAMVAWFAGIFYLPRLFVYHANITSPAESARFKTMERRLLYGIMTPSMVVTILLGLWLLYEYAWVAYKSAGWLHTKLALVVLLVIYHKWCARLVRAFREDRNRHSSTFYRWFNEFPVLLLVGIVVMVVVKPF